MEGWTKDEVREWLISDVKVSPTDAQRFFDEDVSGEYLVEFTKREILDMDIKHGPAVKITKRLKQWKEQSRTQPQCPAYVLSWTKEQVKLWLLQHLKIYDKYAQRLLEEDVSGDCLVYFETQDFKDLDFKQGPTVKILAELRRLKDKAEPELLPVTEEENKQPSVEPEPSLSQPETQRKSSERTTSPNTHHVQNTQRTPPQQPPAPNTKTAAEVSGTGSFEDNIEIMIYKVLNNLVEEEIKHFCFHLKDYTSSKYNQIPRSKLERADQADIASLLCQNYVEEAPDVTVKILRAINKNDSASELEKTVGALKEKKMSSKDISKTEADQGDKLKNLLTCGGNALDNYDKFVIVLNKSHRDQVQHLHFLSKLKLFCVLDFDPNSVLPGGVCHSYREERVANLHSPVQYKGKTESIIIEKLNLYKQTSWVFCNGRNDLEDECHQELDYKSWLKTSCRNVEHLVSFICKPEVLCHREFLIIFLLLSPVETEKDPMFDTYRCFYKNTSEKNIVTLCESKSTYLKWKELVQEKCDTDIDPFSINELSLREINGTIMALGPISRSPVKLLPSADSSSIVLKQKEEDLMTALEVLCVNQCENIHDENSEQFKQFKLKQEEEFYRGGKVKWWNFYFCEKDKERPFIKRDKYENVKKMIRTQLKDPQNTCVVLTLFHHPGCGATTLAMHVMWDLRKELRCAVLKENKVQKEEVAHQIIKLMKLDPKRPCTVLLLVDDSKDSTHELLNFIQKTVSNMNVDLTQTCKVIVLNCVRSHSPKDQYREHDISCSQYLTASLTPDEQQDFEKKLKELEKSHNKPENFYSFMLMKSNFDPQYTQDLASNTLESFDMSTKKGKLFAFLALLNTYVADSEISLSLCEDFLGIKMIRWVDDGLLNQMAPYTNLLIIDKVEDWGGYKGVRILHNHIAAACLEEFERRHKLTVSDITIEILHCDLFYRPGVVKNRLMKSIEQMLIERQRRKGEKGEREPFSPLVEKIHSEKGRQIIQNIFVQASSRFETSASIPQALARYLYIKEKDFPEALKWAQKAKNIAKNPFMFDTIAQIHKSNLKYNMDREKQEKSHSPEGLKQNLKIAVNAIEAFERAQDLAPNDEEEESEDDQDYPRKSYTIYGYVGVVEITFLVFEVLGRLPFFNENQDPMNKMYLRSFLERNIPITSVHKENNEINDRYVAVIREHEHFILNLKNKVKDTFDILSSFFTYFKPVYSEFDSKDRWTIAEHFKKYVQLFCIKPEEVNTECQSNPQLALKMAIEQKRLFLEEKNVDTFSGILSIQNLAKSAEEMEEITQAYAYLYKHKDFNTKTQATKVTTNYILSNIVLNLSKPKSKHVLGYTVLSDMLRKTLQDVGLRSNFPDLYYTALLLFWPNPSDKTTDIQKYVTAIRHASRKHLSAYFKGRSTVAHLFLAKGSSLTRLVSKLQLDKNFKEMSRISLAQLWRSGDIFKEKIIKDRLLRVKGTIEGGEISAIYGNQKVHVRPALISGTRSGFSIEKVSFFLGFAINGPLAYDIQSEN